MKTLKDGTAVLEEAKSGFIGRVHECGECHTMFEIESVDDIDHLHPNGMGWWWWADVRCPGCETPQRINRIGPKARKEAS